MRAKPDSPKRMGEPRRYFPEWTHRVLKSGLELEADHNSYLAGGYAEEFGYRAQPGYSRGVPVLEDETPERCRERRSQAQLTHPGYPLRAHPLTVDLDRARRDRGSMGRARAAGQDSSRSTRHAYDVERHGSFVVVHDREYERKRDRARMGAMIVTRMTAALFALRWALRHR